VKERTVTVETANGVERYHYNAYPHQKAFHESLAPHRLLGGAAGPGKTLALIEDHMLGCNQFGLDEAKEVHTVIFRRTHPKLEATVITRFREKIPRELYKSFNESKNVVTWLNGATTQFASMQYEHDVWGWQGQWYKIAYDELTEFTFPQWQNISAWNRCPVSKRPTKDGASNPIGVGARWVEDLFIKKQPCAEMEPAQKALYKPENYIYFPATYLDNPIFATDAQYLANLDSYQAPVSKALKMGIWGISGGYFDGAWDEAYNVYKPGSVKGETWDKRWLAGDWGFDHNSAIHWFHMDGNGIVRIYRELICNRHTPEELAERIGTMSNGENYQFFSLAHDAFAQRHDTNPIALRIGNALKPYGIPMPEPSTKDKRGREQILYDYLKQRVRTGEIYNDNTGTTEPVKVAKLQISEECPNLIRTIEKAPRDEDDRETIAEFLGDDALQSAGYGLYAMFGKPAAMPVEEKVSQQIKEMGIIDPTQVAIWHRKLDAKERRKTAPVHFGRRLNHRKKVTY
jgi:hypothetical protein